MPDWKKLIEEGIPKAEANYEALCEQAEREVEAEREAMRQKGMTEAEIEARENEIYGSLDDDEDEAEPKRGVDIDWENEFAIVDGKQVGFAELENIIIANENFVGKRANLEAVQRFWKLCKLANELKAGSSWVVDVGMRKPEKKHRTAGIWVDVKWMAAFKRPDMDLFIDIFRLSDRFDVSGVKAGKIRFSFDVKGTWE